MKGKKDEGKNGKGIKKIIVFKSDRGQDISTYVANV